MAAAQIHLHRRKATALVGLALAMTCFFGYTLLTNRSSNSGAKESSFPGYRDCRPKQKVAFLKTHKCASTSIQNIMMRYGLAHQLNFVLPLRGNYLGRTATFTRAMLFDTPWEEAGMEYHMFALHTKWDSVQVGEVLGDRGDVAYVSMLRDPVELFRSMWDYLPQKAGTMQAGSSLEQFALHVARNLPANHPMLGKNQMLKDFGLTDQEITDRDIVRDKIQEIDEDFDLVMMAERFEDSILLLRDELCWDYRDVVNFKLNSKETSKKSSLSEEARRALREWLWADQMLYEHFKSKFEARVEDYGVDRLDQERNILRSAIRNVRDSCVESRVSGNTVHDAYSKPYGKDIEVYQLKEGADDMCQYYVMNENAFIDILRDLQTDKSQKIIEDKENEI